MSTPEELKPNCDCLPKVADKVAEFKRKQGVKVSRATIKEQTWLFTSGHSRTMSTVEVTRDDRKRPEPVTLVHSYCPFCGKAYPKAKGE